ncbi:hypothetical protein ACFX2I_025792 [Malus domestica]
MKALGIHADAGILAKLIPSFSDEVVMIRAYNFFRQWCNKNLVMMIRRQDVVAALNLVKEMRACGNEPWIKYSILLVK